MPVIELTVVPPSLMDSAAMWECASIIPGVTKRPLASMISASAGTFGAWTADRGNPAVAQHDGSVLDRAARHSEHRASTNGDHCGPRGLCERPRLVRSGECEQCGHYKANASHV